VGGRPEQPDTTRKKRAGGTRRYFLDYGRETRGGKKGGTVELTIPASMQALTCKTIGVTTARSEKKLVGGQSGNQGGCGGSHTECEARHRNCGGGKRVNDSGAGEDEGFQQRPPLLFADRAVHRDAIEEKGGKGVVIQTRLGD